MQKKIDITTIKALAIDLDGTALLPDSSLGERTIQCLKRLKANGIQLILCTGRAIESAARFYNALGADGPMVFFNGAEVADVPEVKLLSSNLLSLDIVDFGIDLAHRMNIHFQVFLPPQADGKRALLVEKQRPESEMYHKHTSILPVVTDLKAAIAAPGLQGVIKAMFIANPALHPEIRRAMTDRFGNRVYIVNTYPSFLEIMNAGVSKGEGLKIVMDYRGLKPEEVIAFGDEENDLPMFTVAGFSAAPSSAKEKVRAAADFIFGSNAEEGLAIFLEELFF
ncbi:MAG: Cof-type HAD-IIB family hydrolase [Treponema sp.]|nr:Cof-type HAD-IIB family hydrolase [Treponema sp.]